MLYVFENNAIFRKILCSCVDVAISMEMIVNPRERYFLILIMLCPVDVICSYGYVMVLCLQFYKNVSVLLLILYVYEYGIDEDVAIPVSLLLRILRCSIPS